MSDLNIIDKSVTLFSIDKPVLIFQVSPDNNQNINNNNISVSSSNNPINLGQTSLIVSNLCSEYIALRIKTTKKQYYSVAPAYSVISPESKEKIEFNYYVKEGEKVSNEGHKFKFEAFIISENEKDLDPRNLFNMYILKKIGVKGTQIKTGVKFIEKELNNKMDKNNIINNPLSSKSLGLFSEKSFPHHEESSLISKENPLISTVDKNKLIEKSEKASNADLHNDFGTPKIKRFTNSNKKLYDYTNQTDEEKTVLLNNLKVEYYKLKNELDNLINNYYNLRNHVDLEENNQDNIKEENSKNNYPSINSKEIKLSQSICIVLFILGIILGFYLS